MKQAVFVFDHIALTVANLQKSMQWYSDTFGFESLRVFDKPDLKLRGGHMSLGNLKLELLAPYEPRPLPEYRKKLETDLMTVGTKHLALRVDDLNSAYEALKKKGVEFLSEPNTGKKSTHIFCRDLDGILIEIREEL